MAQNTRKSDLSSSYSRNLIKGNVTGNLGITSAVRYQKIYGEGVDQFDVIRMLHRENAFRFWWYLLTIVATLANIIIFPQSWLASLEIFILILNIDFVCRGKVIGIYLGILDCVFYIVVCSLSGLWGEVIRMAAINIPLNILAIVNWTKNIKKKKTNATSAESSSTIEVRKLTKKAYLIYSAILVASCVGGYFLLNALGTSSIVMSTILFGVGIVYKLLSSFRYKESYIMAIISCLLGTGLWVTMIFIKGPADAIAPTIMYVANLADAIYGLIFWNGLYRESNINGGKLFAKRKVKIKNIIKLRRMYKNLYFDESVNIEQNQRAKEKNNNK
ncbi:MAG: nicotinamide mononucleotide transporter [Clostridia bacterium]|nr:nicotinamide mononucleotide transporter [Clostridia bacterium]